MTEERIIEAVGVTLGRTLDSGKTTLQAISTGKFNESFFLKGDGLDVVVRIAPADGTPMIFYEDQMMTQEPEIHAFVRERTRVPVPEILAFDTSRRVLDRNFLVMERLPGKPLTEVHGITRDQMDGIFRTVGEWLAQVHAIHGEKYGYLGEHRPMAPMDTWAAAFHGMWNLLISDIETCGGYSEKEAGLMRALLDPFLPVFDRDVPASLLHMDVWHQNILVDDDGTPTGLIDWDRALWGDPEIEFAVLDYCGVSEPAFWKGYGQERDLSREAQTRGIFYLLYEVQKYIVIERARRDNPTAAESYRQRVFALARRLV